ncbi:hypothetical protein BpHYR1_038671 [Brachionus plicatilis]|uniref:Uncharacterized protein n=1 Tax=Brachionus plicatilis TaxID=10195 RepID=A0A3M7Q657_BRAPC|nr:hypothetical protein BpHYR1_038671 [Brachionus plicatilis]
MAVIRVCNLVFIHKTFVLVSFIINFGSSWFSAIRQFKSNGQIEIKINRKLNIHFTIKLFNIQYSIK